MDVGMWLRVGIKVQIHSVCGWMAWGGCLRGLVDAAEDVNVDLKRVPRA